LSSSAAPLEEQPPAKPRKRTTKVGRTRKLKKRIERKPDGRYLIYYKPS
jgi:hypothetical protein